MNKNIFGIIILLIILAVPLIYFLNKSESSVGISENNLDEKLNITLEDAREKIGMTCEDTSDVRSRCTWNGIGYSFLKVLSWERDQKLRVEDCEVGFVNEKYKMVSDGETWYATTDFEEDSAKLSNALNEVGLVNKVIYYCR